MSPPSRVPSPAVTDEQTFEERMARARAAHVRVKTCHQPGNSYRTEYICKCGAFVMATNWEQHVLDAADALEAAFQHDPAQKRIEEAARQIVDGALQIESMTITGQDRRPTGESVVRDEWLDELRAALASRSPLPTEGD